MNLVVVGLEVLCEVCQIDREGLISHQLTRVVLIISLLNLLDFVTSYDVRVTGGRRRDLQLHFSLTSFLLLR